MNKYERSILKIFESFDPFQAQKSFSDLASKSPEIFNECPSLISNFYKKHPPDDENAYILFKFIQEDSASPEMKKFYIEILRNYQSFRDNNKSFSTFKPPSINLDYEISKLLKSTYDFGAIKDINQSITVASKSINTSHRNHVQKNYVVERIKEKTEIKLAFDTRSKLKDFFSTMSKVSMLDGVAIAQQNSQSGNPKNLYDEKIEKSIWEGWFKFYCSCYKKAVEKKENLSQKFTDEYITKDLITKKYMYIIGESYHEYIAIDIMLSEILIYASENYVLSLKIAEHLLERCFETIEKIIIMSTNCSSTEKLAKNMMNYCKSMPSYNFLVPEKIKISFDEFENWAKGEDEQRIKTSIFEKYAIVQENCVKALFNIMKNNQNIVINIHSKIATLNERMESSAKTYFHAGKILTLPQCEKSNKSHLKINFDIFMNVMRYPSRRLEIEERIFIYNFFKQQALKTGMLEYFNSGFLELILNELKISKRLQEPPIILDLVMKLIQDKPDFLDESHLNIICDVFTKPIEAEKDKIHQILKFVYFYFYNLSNKEKQNFLKNSKKLRKKILELPFDAFKLIEDFSDATLELVDKEYFKIICYSLMIIHTTETKCENISQFLSILKLNIFIFQDKEGIEISLEHEYSISSTDIVSQIIIDALDSENKSDLNLEDSVEILLEIFSKTESSQIKHILANILKKIPQEFILFEDVLTLSKLLNQEDQFVSKIINTCFLSNISKFIGFGTDFILKQDLSARVRDSFIILETIYTEAENEDFEIFVAKILKFYHLMLYDNTPNLSMTAVMKDLSFILKDLIIKSGEKDLKKLSIHIKLMLTYQNGVFSEEMLSAIESRHGSSFSLQDLIFKMLKQGTRGSSKTLQIILNELNIASKKRAISIFETADFIVSKIELSLADIFSLEMSRAGLEILLKLEKGMDIYNEYNFIKKGIENGISLSNISTLAVSKILSANFENGSKILDSMIIQKIATPSYIFRNIIVEYPHLFHQNQLKFLTIFYQNIQTLLNIDPIWIKKIILFSKEDPLMEHINLLKVKILNSYQMNKKSIDDQIFDVVIGFIESSPNKEILEEFSRILIKNKVKDLSRLEAILIKAFSDTNLQEIGLLILKAALNYYKPSKEILDKLCEMTKENLNTNSIELIRDLMNYDTRLEKYFQNIQREGILNSLVLELTEKCKKGPMLEKDLQRILHLLDQASIDISLGNISSLISILDSTESKDLTKCQKIIFKIVERILKLFELNQYDLIQIENILIKQKPQIYQEKEIISSLIELNFKKKIILPKFLVELVETSSNKPSFFIINSFSKSNMEDLTSDELISKTLYAENLKDFIENLLVLTSNITIVNDEHSWIPAVIRRILDTDLQFYRSNAIKCVHNLFKLAFSYKKTNLISLKDFYLLVKRKLAVEKSILVEYLMRFSLKDLFFVEIFLEINYSDAEQTLDPDKLILEELDNNLKFLSSRLKIQVFEFLTRKNYPNAKFFSKFLDGLANLYKISDRKSQAFLEVALFELLMPSFSPELKDDGLDIKFWIEFISSRPKNIFHQHEVNFYLNQNQEFLQNNRTKLKKLTLIASIYEEFSCEFDDLLNIIKCCIAGYDNIEISELFCQELNWYSIIQKNFIIKKLKESCLENHTIMTTFDTINPKNYHYICSLFLLQEFNVSDMEPLIKLLEFFSLDQSNFKYMPKLENSQTKLEIKKILSIGSLNCILESFELKFKDVSLESIEVCSYLMEGKKWQLPQLKSIASAFLELNKIHEEEHSKKKNLEYFVNALILIKNYGISSDSLDIILETVLKSSFEDIYFNLNKELVKMKNINFNSESTYDLFSEFSKINKSADFYKDLFLSTQKSSDQIYIPNISKKIDLRNWTKKQFIESARYFRISLKEWSPENMIQTIQIVMEAYRIIFDTNLNQNQILCCVIAHGFLKPPNKGILFQMKTGEGKSSVICLLAILYNLFGKKVHVIAGNSILAERDARKYEELYSYFGMTVSRNVGNSKECYKADVVYGDISNFQFDSLAPKNKNFPKIEYEHILIIDEADSCMIDDCKKIARYAKVFPGFDLLSVYLYKIWNALIVNCDQNLDKDIKALKEKVTQNIRNNLEKEVDYTIVPANLKEFLKDQIPVWVNSAITAFVLRENIDYIIRKFEIRPVDETKGTIDSMTSFSNGVHQFLQIKHQLEVTPENLTTDYISNIGYIMKYCQNNFCNIIGLTGTLGTDQTIKRLNRVYKASSFIIPRTNPEKVIEFPLVSFENTEKWFTGLQESVKLLIKAKRGILIIFETIELAMLFSEYLVKKGISYPKLFIENGSNQERFVENIDQGEVICSTIIAGRGTDINTIKIEATGGLHVILTFMPQSKRIYDQCIGRTGRQGKKGSYQLILLDNVEKNFFEQAENQSMETFELVDSKEMKRRDENYENYQIRIAKEKKKIESNKGLLEKHLGSEYDMVRFDFFTEIWALNLRKAEIDPNFDLSKDIFISDIDKNSYYQLTLGKLALNSWTLNDHSLYFWKSIEFDKTNVCSLLSLADYIGRHDQSSFAKILIKDDLIQNKVRNEYRLDVEDKNLVLKICFKLYQDAFTLIEKERFVWMKVISSPIIDNDSILYSKLSERLAYLSEVMKKISHSKSCVIQAAKTIDLKITTYPKDGTKLSLSELHSNIMWNSEKIIPQLQDDAYKDLPSSYSITFNRLQPIEVMKKFIEKSVSNMHKKSLILEGDPGVLKILTGLREKYLALSMNDALKILNSKGFSIPKAWKAIKSKEVDIVKAFKDRSFKAMFNAEIFGKVKLKSSQSSIQSDLLIKDAISLIKGASNEVQYDLEFKNEDAEKFKITLAKLKEAKLKLADLQIFEAQKLLQDIQNLQIGTQITIFMNPKHFETIVAKTDLECKLWLADGKISSHLLTILKKTKLFNEAHMIELAQADLENAITILNSMKINENDVISLEILSSKPFELIDVIQNMPALISIELSNLNSELALQTIDFLEPFPVTIRVLYDNLTYQKARELVSEIDFETDTLIKSKVHNLKDLFHDKSTPQFIYDYEKRGLISFTEIKLKSAVPYKKLALILGIVALQGLTLLAATKLGLAFAVDFFSAEILSDLLFIQDVYTTGTFSWNKYLKYKTFNMAQSLVSSGIAVAFKKIKAIRAGANTARASTTVAKSEIATSFIDTALEYGRLAYPKLVDVIKSKGIVPMMQKKFYQMIDSYVMDIFEEPEINVERCWEKI